MRTALLLLMVGACAGGTREEAAHAAPAHSSTATAVVVAPGPAPSAAASHAASAASSASPSAACNDPTWWLAYLVTLAKSDDAKKLAFVARQKPPRDDELRQAEEALASAAAEHDTAARARTIADVEATIAKKRPACAPPFSLTAPPRHSLADAGALGWLEPRVIQHVVRANFGRAKLCYQDALRKDPSTGGRIETKLVIAPDGTVSSTSDATKPDGGVQDATFRVCIRKLFSTLTFPPPDGGVVTVVYPLIFSPGAD